MAFEPAGISEESRCVRAGLGLRSKVAAHVVKWGSRTRPGISLRKARVTAAAKKVRSRINDRYDVLEVANASNIWGTIINRN